MILFSDGEAPVPAVLTDQGFDVVPIEQAAELVLATLRGQPQAAMVTPDGSSGPR